MVTLSLELVNLLVNFLVVSIIAIIERSTIYKHAQYWSFFHPNKGMGVTPLYIFGEQKYLHVFGSWHLTKIYIYIILRFMHNMKHKCERSIMKISFDILQKMFQELKWKFELYITFLPDAFTCLSHNLLCN